MNTLIETLNAWADHALRFAWPMLWQSSLLIALLFALELLLKRKVRPAVRYALWLVVLVKLLLPPSLAFPTSPRWWLRDANAAPPGPRSTKVVVSYGAPESSPLPAVVPTVILLPPRPHLSSAAWLLLSTVTVSLGLIAWMIARWRRVAQRARRAAAAPSWLNELLRELRQPVQSGQSCPVEVSANEPQRRDEHRVIGAEDSAQPSDPSCSDLQVAETCQPLRPSRLCGSKVYSSTAWLRLRLTDHPQSPAVCGLFRPVILLPRALAERLPPKQLRAVLLHELLHLRRGDVWVNCAQALLQIAYWWHPLLWLANARIRRLRQEAVDDAVMLALNKDADAYAPTLLEVAKLALHRPLASLGLVGILESRSSLRQRIERLVDFHPPRRAGLTLGSGVALFGFAALALPMGEAPAPSKLAPPESAAMPNGSTLLATTNTAPLDLRINAATLVQDGKLLFEMGKLTEAEAKLKLALKAQPRNEAALYYLNLVSEAKFAQAAKGADTLPVPSPYARTNLLRTAPGRQAIISKLDHIRLGSVSFDGLPLGEVLRTLSEETRKRDPEKRGINFLVAQNAPNAYNSGYSFIPALDTNRQSELAPPPAQPEVADTKIKISPPLTDIRLADVLDAIVKVADRPIKYAIEDYAIVFSLRQHEPNPLYVRTFKVDPKTVLEALQPRARQAERNGVELAARDARDYFAGGPEGVARAEREAVTRPLRDYFARLGVDLDPVKNPGKAIFFNDRQGMIIVRATMQDLDIIETAIQTLNVVPPQINIKARFVEVPEEDSKALGFDWYLGNVLMTNSPTGGQVGIRQPPGNPSNAASPGGVFPGAFPAGTNGQALTSGLRPVGSGSPLPAMTGILTEPQYRVVLRALEQRAGTDLVAQPEVTVINGRQAQCKAVDVRTIVEGIDPRALTPPGITSTNDADSSALATESMEFGPTLDVTPSVLPDGHTINLPLTASLLEFLGYEDNRTNLVTVYVNGKQKQVSPPRPIVRIAQITSQANVWDGQTLVLGGLVSERVVTTKDSVPGLGNLPLVGRLFRSESKNAQKRKLLVFITPTIIDPAGNRVHSDEEMPSTRQAIPQQPSR